MPKRSDSFRGLDVTSPINRISTGLMALALNCRAYLQGGFKLRTLLSAPIITLDSSVVSLARMNDTTPAGPSSGYVILSASNDGRVYANAVPVATGLTGNPVSMVPFRPNTSVQPWMYIGDNAPSPNVTVDSSFNCSGMIKVRSDGLSRKMGIEEPQNAPSVTFPGGGTGVAQILYRYTYRGSETGATSNPSPESIPGTNAQASPSATQVAASGGVINPDITVNATQYEGNGTQIRTKGGVSAGTITDYIIARGFSLPTLPTNVNIDGIQVDLNWLGQNAGTGVLSGVQLYYLGGAIGNPKFPGIQNQSFATDAFQGSNGDTWGATLSPGVINDPSFGFGVQITTQESGGSDRSFVNFMAITVYYSTQDANITPSPSPDPQVDKIDIYRMGGALPDFTYVGTAQNTSAAYNDILSDLAAVANPLLEFDNFEPFPSIDLPRSGILNSISQVLSYVSGDHFNIRWLPGTDILIGSPDQVAYIAVRRPSSTTSWDMTNNDPTITPIPDGTNLIWNIAEPDLAQQPLPYIFGPTDNIPFEFAVGDPLRPGTLYWCKGSNLDSAPDTNQLEVTDPSEALVNGAMSGGLGVLFSIKRAWVILPNFFNALATVTGTSGSTWTLQATGITRGLFIPRCLVVEGGGGIYFRVDDGIHISRSGSTSVSITDDTLYPLFTHEGSTQAAVTRNGVTIYPPDDTRPELQQFSIQGPYLYWDYMGLDGNRHTLMFDTGAVGWVWDTYATSPTIHAANQGESVQGVLVGCQDGTIRQMTSASGETPTGLIVTPAVGGQGWQHLYQVTVEYTSTVPVTLGFIAADANNGSYAPNSLILPSGGGVPTKYTTKVSANKWKWLQFSFSFTDPNFACYLLGFAIDVKDWGSSAAYRTVAPFTPSGGEGGQP